MSIGRICQRDVDLADAEENVCVAAERMHQRTVGSLLILNDAKVPVGILTDRDLVVRVLGPGKEPATTLIGEVMTPYPKVISELAPIESALALMRSGAFRRLPVVDSEGKLVGLVTLDDILQLLAEEFRQVGSLLERETPRAAATAGLK